MQSTATRFTLLEIIIPVFDVDADDPPTTLQVQISSIGASSIGTFYYDKAMTTGACTPVSTSTSIPATGLAVHSSTGRVVFVPRAYDWGSNFTKFEFTLTDTLSLANATYTMTINVIHVNKAPFIVAENFLISSQFDIPIILNESTWSSFD